MRWFVLKFVHYKIIRILPRYLQVTTSKALYTLQEIHDAACKANADKITMERPTFNKIALSVQSAWEQVKIGRCANEENTIRYSLKQIQASIAGLEQMYEGIQAQVTKNNVETTCKLNEIQTAITRLENKHEAIERTAKEAPKTYADIIKTSTINTKEKGHCRNACPTKTTTRCPSSRTSKIRSHVNNEGSKR